MRSKLIRLLLVLTIILTTSGQAKMDNIMHVWGNMFWGPSIITVDYSGNIYLCGEFDDTIFFGSKDLWLANVDSTDFFITKINYDGTLAWMQVVSGMGSEQIYDIEVDNKGYIYLAGQFDQTMLIDTLFIDIGSANDYYVCKLDPEGNLIDLYRGSEAGEDLSIRAIEVDESGQIYLIGQAGGNSVFDFQFEPLGRTIGGQSGFMVKLDSVFNGKWMFSICDSADLPYPDGCFYSAIATDQFNNIYISGYVDGAADDYFFISKANQDGKLLWMETITVTHSLGIANIFVDNYDDVYLFTGSHPGITINFPEPVNGAGIIAKYSKEGEYMWSMGLESDLLAYVVDHSGYVIASYYKDWGVLDGLIIIDPNGIIVLDQPLEGIEFQFMATDPEGNVYYNGFFNEGISIDGQVVNPQNGQNYVIGQLKVEEMVGSPTTMLNRQDKAQLVYPNPTDGMVYIEVKGDERILGIEVFDLSGRLVLSDTQIGNIIDLGEVKDGIYMIKVRTNKDLIIDKIMKY